MIKQHALHQKKVAHITNVDWILSHFLLNQLASIQQDGYDVIGISSPDARVPPLEHTPFRHIQVSMTRTFTPLADLVSLWRLYTLMRREKFTIVHTHNPKPGLLGQIAARLAGVPVVVNTLHGFYFHDHMHPLWRRFYILMEKVAASCSDLILSQNSEDIHTAVREGICAPEQIQFLGNGIDVQRFDRDRVDAATLAQKRRALGLPLGAPVIGFVGRLVAEKGILELLAAARIVRQHVPGARLLIIGPVDAEKADALTPEIAHAYDLADACVFTGMRQDMVDLYAMMDVLVLPSHREGFPRTPMEAAAMGVPCVVTDVRGCREAVQHERNGLLVPLGDVPALAAAITRVISEPAAAQRFGVEGRRMALERFDEQIVFAKVKRAYAELLRRKGLVVVDVTPVEQVVS